MVKKEKASTVATSNHTLNYDLPLWTGEDLTSWMGNLNDAMNKIDDGIHDAAMLAQGVQNIGDNLKDLLEKTEQDNIRITASLEALQNTANELQTGLAGVREGLTAANTAIGGISTEQTSLMTQMDAMQDDIGKLMDMRLKKYTWVANKQLPAIGETSIIATLASAQIVNGIAYFKVVFRNTMNADIKTHLFSFNSAFDSFVEKLGYQSLYSNQINLVQAINVESGARSEVRTDGDIKQVALIVDSEIAIDTISTYILAIVYGDNADV